MKKPKHDDTLLDEYQSLKSELRFDQVDTIIRNHPKDWRHRLELLGFKWYDEDGYSQQEILEENQATPNNENQRMLVSYFDGAIPLDDNLLDLFETEKNSDDVNFPLFRKYFRKGNTKLKDLIILALSKHPTDEGYLWDLAFFHEHRTIMKELIDAYHAACLKEEKLLDFENLARNFWHHTAPDEYDALYALRNALKHNKDKLAVIEKLIKERETDNEPIKF